MSCQRCLNPVNSAHNDEAIVRKREFTSTTPCSDDDGEPGSKRPRTSKTPEADDSSLDDQIKHIIESMNKHHTMQVEMAKANLEIAQAREKREQEEREERLTRKHILFCRQQLQQVAEWMASPIECLRKEGKKLFAELQAGRGPNAGPNA